jgi:MFS transporter, DHA2 family, multidrug resistance protein
MRAGATSRFSITTLFSGIFIVVAGGLADRFGRVKLLTYVGLRFAAAIAPLFNVLMVVVAIIAIALTVPRDDPGVGR